MITKEIRAKLEKDLQQKCEQAKIPGMAIIACREGERVFEKYYGYCDVKREIPVTSDTIFGVASITKSFASLAIMQLADAGRLTPEDSVKKWIPEFQLPDQANSEDVTIHHLMTHTTGLPGLSAVNQARANSIARDPDGEYLFGEIPSSNGKRVNSVMDIIEVIAKSTDSILGQPGEVFNYSNESYAILQEIIERASEEPFLDYINRHVLLPLEMSRSTFLTEDLDEIENVTKLYAYSKDKKRNVFQSPTWWDVGKIYTNGSLKASATDLMKYLEVYRQKGTVDGKKTLSESSFEKMVHPHVMTPNDVQYGYGFTIGNELGVNVFGHGGGIKGVSSFMLVSPEEALTVCVLINIAEADAEDMAYTAMRHLLHLQEEEVQDHIYEISTKDFAQLTGKYESAEGQKIRVSENNSELTMHIDHNDIRLAPVAKNKFLTPDNKMVVFTERDKKIVGIFRGLRYIEKV